MICTYQCFLILVSESVAETGTFFRIKIISNSGVSNYNNVNTRFTSKIVFLLFQLKVLHDVSVSQLHINNTNNIPKYICEVEFDISFTIISYICYRIQHDEATGTSTDQCVSFYRSFDSCVFPAC